MVPQVWTPAFPLSEISPGTARLFRHDTARIAVFHLDDGEVFAVDDRCPHEGYPLVQGQVCGTTLTCCWHNFKFDLRDGRCLMGDEAVRAWPARVVAGQIELDLREPDAGVQRAALWESLEAGMVEHALGRVARDVTRLLTLQATPEEIAAFSARYDGERAEYGSTHALPLALDGLRIADRLAGLDKVLPLCQALDMAGRASIRRPKRIFSASPLQAPPEAEARRLEALVEAEQGEAAAGLMAGLLAAGCGRALLEPALFALVSAHFLDFGHALIYTTKVFDLLDRVGWESAPSILPPLVYGVAVGTREDTLPPWRPWGQRVQATEAHFPAWLALPRAAPGAADPASPALVRLQTALLDGTPAAAFGALTAALSSEIALDDVATALVLAASERILRFEVSIDREQRTQESWLDVTHLLTSAHAVRLAAQRWQDPRVFHLFYQVGRFIQRSRPLDGPRADWTPRPAEAAAVVAAIGAKDAPGALGAAAGALAGGQARALAEALEDLAMDRAATRPIVVAHLIKTAVVGFAERDLTGDDRPALAVVRLFASPVTERRLGRLVREAIRLVRDGRPPEKRVS